MMEEAMVERVKAAAEKAFQHRVAVRAAGERWMQLMRESDAAALLLRLLFRKYALDGGWTIALTPETVATPPAAGEADVDARNPKRSRRTRTAKLLGASPAKKKNRRFDACEPGAKTDRRHRQCFARRAARDGGRRRGCPALSAGQEGAREAGEGEERSGEDQGRCAFGEGEGGAIDERRESEPFFLGRSEARAAETRAGRR